MNTDKNPTAEEFLFLLPSYPCSSVFICGQFRFVPEVGPLDSPSRDPRRAGIHSPLLHLTIDRPASVWNPCRIETATVGIAVQFDKSPHIIPMCRNTQRQNVERDKIHVVNGHIGAVFVLAAVAGVSGLMASPQASGSIPCFEDYPVTEIFRGIPSDPILLTAEQRM